MSQLISRQSDNHEEQKEPARVLTMIVCILISASLLLLIGLFSLPQHTTRWWSIILAIHALLFVIVIGLQYLSLRRVKNALNLSRRELDERRRTESELRRASDRLQLATTAANIGIWDWDVINDELVWDDAMYRLYGVERENFSGTFDAWATTLAPEDVDRVKEEVQKALSGRGEFGGEFKIVWPDGSTHYTKAASRTFRDESGRPVRVVGVNYDVTERKLAEAHLEAANARSEALISTIDGIVWEADAASFRFLYVSPQAERFLGYPVEQWMEHPTFWKDHIHPDDRERALSYCMASVADMRDQDFEYRMIAADGREIWLRDIVSVVVEGSQPTALRGIMVDVSNRRTAEEENRKLINRLGERVKELTALHRTARILQDKTNNVPGLLQKIVTILPLAWQYPEVTAARITLGDIEVETPNYAPSKWSQQAAFTVGDICGVLEVVYLKERPPADLGPFVFEERNLIDSLSEMISSALNHEYSQEALRESERRFSDTLTNIEMIAVMADRNGEITFVNDYLLRLTGWKLHEAIGRNWFEMFIPEHEKYRVSAILEGVEPTGEVIIHWENEIKTRAGEHRIVKWTNTTLRGPDGELIGVAALGDDITERKLAEQQLKASSDQLRALSERLRRAKEEEGIRIARELHDELGSGLTSLKWSLLGLEKLYSEDQPPPVRETVIPKLEQMVGLVDETINSVRRISSELRPGILDDLGVVAAIEWQTLQFQANSGIVCEFESLVDDVTIDRDQGTVLFRIFQEAMTNVLRHATATKVNVILEEEEGEFLLEISDNGRGITDVETRGALSLGLLGMRERANSVGGRVDIKGATGKGTKVIVRLPIEWRAHASKLM